MNAPSTFQRCMNMVTHKLFHVVSYLDDLLVFSVTFQGHLADLRGLFVRLRYWNLKLKPSKCQFAKDQVTYLGHVISKDG